MEFVEALQEVLDAASQPKKYPPGMTPVTLPSSAIDSHDLQARAWHDSLTPAQEMVCRWVWDNCAQHYGPWEQFEVGFLNDYNWSSVQSFTAPSMPAGLPGHARRIEVDER